ncbi:heavy metal translocating P-type ATPase [uncultured Prevotella sp.]|uniref:heavy metal translocating P-type ATPase n=1 Tax=uncultured Prevotella sp. TaxID=159272 RepID=UPI002602545B|nr:heavy metal translocating P-type ATPase [uncultured Prevotella sp.]
MNVKLIRIIVGAVLLAVAALVEHTVQLPVWQMLLIYLVPYLVVGYDVVGEAFEGICHGEVFDEDFLMFVATVGAMCIGFLPGAEPQFAEAVFVMLFFQVGELFEHYAEHRSRRSIRALMDIRPDTANVLRNGNVQTVSPDTIAVGETIIVKPGERVALDGEIVDGTSALNTVALTGESMPRDVRKGDQVVSGCVNISGVLTVKVQKSFGESTASKIISMVENASEKKSKSEAFITRFARVYTPIVVIVALVLAFVPPLFCGGYVEALTTWLYRALTFLVVSCPCALVISIPLSFFGGIGGASRHGILIKGASYIDALSELDTVVFDKTGTLTHGEFCVEAIHPDKISPEELLHLAAHVERYSTHPIAVSLKQAFGNEADGCKVEDVEEIAGHGVRAVVNGHTVCVGNERMMDSVGAEWHKCHVVGTTVHVSIDGEYAGHIVVADRIKEDAADAIAGLHAMGISNTVMLTGDRKEVGEDVAHRVGIDDCHTQLLPADKLGILEQLLEKKKKNTTLAFVGDGINDAPALARADVGVAMGALGSDAAIEAADVVLMDDKPSKMVTAIRIARRTLGIARQNVWFAIGVKVLVLLLAAVGLATMWMAVFADVGVMVLAVLNAMRTLRLSSD